MNARQQQLMLLMRLLWGAGLATWAWSAGWQPAAALILLAFVFMQPIFTGVEYLLRLSYRGVEGRARPGWGEYLQAGWGEARARIRLFDWQQPFAEQAETDHWPSVPQGRRGVLLLHGFACNRGLWNGWLKPLRAADVPCVALTLQPAFGEIDAYVPAVEAAVLELEQRTGCPPIVVGHSMGGIVARAWWRAHGRADRVCQVLTLGSPHAGTWMARFAFARNAKQMGLHSAWMQALAAGEDEVMGRHFRCYYSSADSMICPISSGAAVQGALAVHLPGVGHVAMVQNATVFQDLLYLLSAENKTPPLKH